MRKPEDIVKFLSKIQVYALILLSGKNNEPLPGKLWYQKELFIVSKLYKDLEDNANFKPLHLGPYSENADSELEELSRQGLIAYAGNKIILTPLGSQVSEYIRSVVNKNNPKKLEAIDDFKEFLNDLSRDELLGFVYFNYPRMADESLVKEGLDPKRNKIMINLYRKQKISLSKAAELANLSVVEFKELAA